MAGKDIAADFNEIWTGNIAGELVVPEDCAVSRARSGGNDLGAVGLGIWFACNLVPMMADRARFLVGKDDGPVERASSELDSTYVQRVTLEDDMLVVHSTLEVSRRKVHRGVNEQGGVSREVVLRVV